MGFAFVLVYICLTSYKKRYIWSILFLEEFIVPLFKCLRLFMNAITSCLCMSLFKAKQLSNFIAQV